IKDKNDASNNIEVNVPPTKPVPPLKKRVPVQTPDRPLAPIAASPKKPVVPATPAKPAVPVSPSTTPGITNVVLTKTSATTMHAAIYHNKLHGKKIRFKLMEDDGGKLVDDELINEIYTLPKDTNYLYIAINLKAIPVSKGDDSVKIGDYVIIEDNIQELYVDVEVLETHKETKTGTLKVNSTAFKQDPVDKTNKVVKISENKLVKEKFDKVKEKAEEAVIYISSEIATAIEVDKNGKIISYPDSGAYNGQDEYKEKEDIYCKKISASKSAYPTFKAYIYRGNIKGEAVKKLKQDLKFKTHENAESTVLEVARHSAKNNKNYGDKGPVPPSTIDKLHGLRYKKGTNNDGKTSYRYRIADINNTNFTITKDYKKEYDSGSMNLGTRSSISIDPWNSNELIGCIGIRDTGGGYHSSFTALTKEQKKTYKNKYHCINNYLEGIIPELTGVYGRRGYSDSEDLSVLESTYDHEVKVFVLVDPLPEIDSCNCKDLKGPKERRPFYDSFGTKTIDYIEKKSTTNKFRALYMLAQKRKETGFLLVNLGKNPMNIKGSGDLGQTSIDTHETIKGKYVSIPGEKFANFSTEDKGFQGYLDLLDSNYNDAYKSLFDDSKTIDDFTAGLEDTGKLGAYATGKAQGGLTGTEDYKLKVKELFNGIKKDYLIMYECKLCKEKDSEKKKKIQEDIDLLKKLK
ncbi:hypothetical protein SL053_002375, partial [Flavobacterium psychrophilum]|nr:hypothetical protein [Flavobacterium psychrophilum]